MIIAAPSRAGQIGFGRWGGGSMGCWTKKHDLESGGKGEKNGNEKSR